MNLFKIARDLFENVAAPGDAKNLIQMNLRELQKTDKSIGEYGGDKRKYYESLQERAEAGEGIFNKAVIDFVESLPDSVLPSSGRAVFIKYIANALRDEASISSSDVGDLNSYYSLLGHDVKVLESNIELTIDRAHAFKEFIKWSEKKPKNYWPETHRTEYMAWLGKQFSESDNDINDDDALEEIRDYFVGSDFDLKILDGDFANVKKEAREWHESLGREKAGMYITPPRKNTVFQDDGMYMVEVSKDKCSEAEILNDLKVEGQLMGNCVGRIHAPRVVKGEELIFSLRSPGNPPVPHVTISLEQGAIREIKAKSNKQVTNPKYVVATLKFLLSRFSFDEIKTAERGWIYSIPLRTLKSANMPENEVVSNLMKMKMGLNVDNVPVAEKIVDSNPNPHEIPHRMHGSVYVYCLAKRIQETGLTAQHVIGYVTSAEEDKVIKNIEAVKKSGLCPYTKGLEELSAYADAITTGKVEFFKKDQIPYRAQENFFKFRAQDIINMPQSMQSILNSFVIYKPEWFQAIKEFYKKNLSHLTSESMYSYCYNFVTSENDVDINSLDLKSLARIWSKVAFGNLKGEFTKVKVNTNSSEATELYKTLIRSCSSNRDIRMKALAFIRRYYNWFLTSKELQHDGSARRRIRAAVDERLVLDLILSDSLGETDTKLLNTLKPEDVAKKISRKTYLELLPDLTQYDDINEALNQKYDTEGTRQKDLEFLRSTESEVTNNTMDWETNVKVKKALQRLPWNEIPETYKNTEWKYYISDPLMRKGNEEYILKNFDKRGGTSQALGAQYLPIASLAMISNHRNPTVRAIVARRIPIDQLEGMVNDHDKKVREIVMTRLNQTPRRASIISIASRLANIH